MTFFLDSADRMRLERLAIRNNTSKSGAARRAVDEFDVDSYLGDRVGQQLGHRPRGAPAQRPDESASSKNVSLTMTLAVREKLEEICRVCGQPSMSAALRACLRAAEVGGRPE